MMSIQQNSAQLIGRHVFPMVISTPFAVGDVYSYLIKDEKIVLVDCGHKSPSSYDQLQAALNKHHLKIEDIDEIWLTHGHPDHFGQAAQLANQSGAIIKGYAKERANFAGNNERRLFRDVFEQHHIPGKYIDEMVRQLDRLQQYQDPVKPEWITEKDVLSSGRFSFNVKHVPGHAPGHVAFYCENGLIFGGDVLLEHISTNALINFDPDTGRRNRSLLQYRESLRWMKEQSGLVLPGHGKQIDDIRAVAENHLSAQKERYQKIIGMLQQKPYALFAICKQLFADALQRGEHFLVISEVLGYLDWAEHEGVIKKEKTSEGIIFEANQNG